MSNDRNKYILIALMIILVGLGYYLLMDSFTEWNYNLDKTKKNPYGTFVTYELLKSKYKKKGFKEIDNSIIESLRKLKKNKTYNYVFINQMPYYDSATVDTICKFAEAGNTVFISCEGLNGAFVDSVLYKTYHLSLTTGFNELYYPLFDIDSLENKDKDSIVGDHRYGTFNFIHPSLKDDSGYTYYIKNKADTIVNYYYRFTPVPDTEWTQPIPDINAISFAGNERSYGSGLNFAVLKHGKGKFVILLSALPFTNYFMRTEKGLEYAEKVFSHLPNQTTLWDNISHEYKYSSADDGYRGDSSFGDSPLYFILQNRALRWAWYLTILGVIIYALFHAKRRQNIIPIIEPKQNNSLKYVETIGQLYFHEEEHIEIANEMRLQFLNFIRQKYYMKTNEIDEAFFKQLCLKSAIEEEKIKSIFDEFKDILKVKSINQQKLHHLNKQLEYFYKTCK
ncbi:MAG: hypothetical protein KAX69_05910 [Chitinophagales bacterium]|nr:hypothetical protein [Chitinophagales bacterium]